MTGGGYQFSQVPIADIPRSVFNRSHGHKTTFNSGLLIPIFVDEALPADTFSVNVSLLARLATPIVPIMDNMYLDVFFFAVPNRLLWANWQKFMGEQENPGDSTDFLVPRVNAGADGFAPLTMWDYFGLPVGVGNINVCNFWGRAYNLIWNEWFRDENLQNSVPVPKDDGPDNEADFVLLRRGKRHDYFTSCLPWPQKGPAAELPIAGYANVVADTVNGGAGVPNFLPANIGTVEQPLFRYAGKGANPNVAQGFVAPDTDANAGNLHWGTTTGLTADLSTSTAVTINALREAFQIQRLLERDARGGTRYTELLRSHFGVVSPDARLQRPEYLGGGSIPVMINPVTQTSETNNAVTPQGNLAGYGVAGGSGIGFTKSFVEHSVILGLAMVRADLSYQQGLPRMFSRRTRYDFYWPAFSHLGEQAVLNKEIFCDGTADDDEVFGYQERWAEYRYFPSKITGRFRSTDPTPLDVWHLGQEFAVRPTLSAEFIQENPPIHRIVAVQDEPQFIMDSHFRMKCVRPMPTYSVPGLIDHF